MKTEPYIINSPIFNKDFFKKGSAYLLEYNSNSDNLAFETFYHVLLYKIDFHELTFMCVVENGDLEDHFLYVSINEVLLDEVKIIPMIEDKNFEKNYY